MFRNWIFYLKKRLEAEQIKQIRKINEIRLQGADHMLVSDRYREMFPETASIVSLRIDLINGANE